MGTLVLLDLMGGVALLLWGLHMVQSGIMAVMIAASRS
jgi:phosphate:Na+ symporter